MTSTGICFLAALSMLAQAKSNGAPEPGDEALRGLDGVMVTVELSPAAARILPTTLEHVENAVDARLGAAGIRNLAREESIRQGAAQLRVVIDTSTSMLPRHALRLDTSVTEPVLLVRDPGRSIVAVTWRAPPTWLLANDDPGVTAKTFEQRLANQLQTFTSSFLAANPPGDVE